MKAQEIQEIQILSPSSESFSPIIGERTIELIDRLKTKLDEN